jgi:two-component system, sensor histidine kinase PdtaS
MKKNLSFFILLLLFQHITLAQKKDKALADSLIAALNNAKEDTVRVNLYAALMYAHVYYKPEVGLTYQQAALELAQKINFKPGIARVKDNAGRLYWRLGNFKDALTLHFEALDLYIQTGNKHREGFVLVEIGQDYLDGSNYPAAKPYLLKAIKLSEETDDRQVIKFAYNILGYLYSKQGDITAGTNAMYAYLKIAEKTGDKSAIASAAQVLALNARNLGNGAEALKYYKLGLQAAIEGGDRVAQAYSHFSMGGFFTEAGNFSAAEDSYATSLKMANEVNDVRLLADVHFAMGDFNMAANKYAEALNHYLIAVAKFKSIANKQDIANVYVKMGMVYVYLKKYDLSKQSLKNALLINESSNSQMPLVDYYNGIELLDSATGNWKDAYLHHKNFIALRDSSFNKETLKKLVASQMQYESDKKEAVVKAEQEKKDLLVREEIKRQRNIRNAAFGVLAAVLVFSIVAYRQRNKLAREKKRSDRLLQDKELLLREIHHRVKNNLEVVSSLLALQSAQIDDPNTKDAMLEGQNRVQSIGIVHQKLYQGTNLGAIEMKDYFINLSESILDSFGADKRVTIECAMENLDVDIDTAVPLGLIVNELLTNTLKYAFPDGQQGKVKIKLLKQKDGVLQLEVSDNGVGKSGITHGTGFGSQLVSLLTQQLSGTMREEMDNGTKIYFEFKTGKAA